MNKTFYIAIILMLFVSIAGADDFLVVSYEPSETALSVSSSEIQSLLKLEGGVGDVPRATHGNYVLKVAWTGQSDYKVQFSHSGLSYNLDGYERLMLDVYIPSDASLFQSDGIIGGWSSNWIPGNWSGGNIPLSKDAWFTIDLDISRFNAGSLNYISAIIFERYDAVDGTIYVDNIRLVNTEPEGVVATGHDSRIDLRWENKKFNESDFDGYNIYRSSSAAGPFTKLNSSPQDLTVYTDPVGSNGQTFHYYVTTVLNSVESGPSDIVSASTFAMTDEELLISIQEATFRYFYDFAHPVSGMSREGSNHPRYLVTTGGSGFGLMSMVVGSERGFITRAEAAEQVLKMLNWMDKVPPRYFGVWSHYINGDTGESLPFGTDPICGDLVETSYFIHGALVVRQYFDSTTDPVEIALRNVATSLFETVEWDYYLKDAGSEELYWLWSPENGWGNSFTITGYNETMIPYLLAVASPTYPIPGSCYYNGYTKSSGYANGNTYYGHKLWVGDMGYSHPLFFTHYSYLGFDPRGKNDKYCNYFDNNRNAALIHHDYAVDNPEGYLGYGSGLWGFTNSDGVWGYYVHCIKNDNGTVSPTAALSSMPFTPTQSISAMRNMYDTYPNLWGPFGFKDAFNPTENWYSAGYLSIDQGPIVIMMENYLSQLCWNEFMKNPEIIPALDSMGWCSSSIGSVNLPSVTAGLEYEYYHGNWSMLPDFDSLTPISTGVVDNFDLSVAQRDDYYGIRYTGYIEVPTDGTYFFYTNSDDGSQLYIGDRLVVDNDGLHGLDGDVSGAVTLDAGKHPITVTFFEQGGGQDLYVKYEGPGIAKQSIPDNVLYRCDLAGDMNSDCKIDMEDLRILCSSWLSPYTFDEFNTMAGNWSVGCSQ